MKKNLLKTSLVAGSLLAFGFLMSSQYNTVNAQAAVSQTGQAQVELTITNGIVTIGISGDNKDMLNLGTGEVSNVDVEKTGEFGPDSFWVSDQKGVESGYYTTLSVTDLVGTTNSSHVISKDNVWLKCTDKHTVTGLDNNALTVGAIPTSDYAQMTDTRTFYTRSNVSVANAGILGVYGTNLQVKVNVPAHTVADHYVGTITYTLYDEAQPS